MLSERRSHTILIPYHSVRSALPVVLIVANNAIMAATAQGASISKRRKFVADGVFYAELNEFFQRELAEEGYSGVEVRVTPTVTDISMCLSSQANPLRSMLKWLLTEAYSHPRNPHPRSPWRARPPHPRTHLAHSEALQVPREFRVSLRREGPEPWPLRCRSMRIITVQAAERIGREEGLLWCTTVHHGERSQGVRGCGERKIEGC